MKLQNSSDGIFAVGVENLLEVVGNLVGGEGTVAHNEIERLAFGDFCDHGLVYVLVEAGDQVIIIHAEHFLTGNGFPLDFAESGRLYSSITWKRRSSGVRSGFTLSSKSVAAEESSGV